jgi:signal transduction histidine kinase
VIGRSIDELRNLRSVVSRSLLLGVIPAFALALLAGMALSQRVQRRIVSANEIFDRIMRGNLQERLPVLNKADDFDRLAISVNRMLDEIERLVKQIKGATDSIAHDLRTPLTRMHTRLERSRTEGHADGNIDDVVDHALADLDLTLGIISALLRIAEIEDGRRRSAFSIVDMAMVARTVAELYEPIAEEKNLTLAVSIEAVPPIRGDYELLIEAIANLLDNAIKFTPAGGRVAIEVTKTVDGGVIVRVADSGTGIPTEERAAVFQRFYRARQSRHIPGYGLGLSMVQAIADLHGFTIAISDGNPGAVIDVTCRPASELSAA